MRRTILIGILLVLTGCHREQQATVEIVTTDSTVTVTDVRFPSPAIGGLLWYRVVVPSVAPGERLPALYFLHGINSSPEEITRQSEIVKLAVQSRLIVVMPEGKFSYYTNARHKSHARWEDAITQDLPRDVAARFPVMTEREHRGIAGISMGGYGAAKMALKHPEMYSFAGAMSGALDITRRPLTVKRWGQSWRIVTIFGASTKTRMDEDVFTLLVRIPDPRGTRWFVSSGVRDPLHDVATRFAAALGRRDAEVDVVDTPGAHDWQDWNAALPQLFLAASGKIGVHR